MQPESMRTPSWRSRSFAFSGAEHAVYPYSRRLTRYFAAGSSAPVSAVQPSPAAGGEAVRRTDSPPAATSAPAPAFGGLRLVEVPGGWPPYDCEAHGPACQAAREASVAEPVRRPGPGYTRRSRAARAVSRLQRRPPGRGDSGPCGRVVQAVRPGDRRDPGRRPDHRGNSLPGRPNGSGIASSCSPRRLPAGQQPRIRRIVTSRPAARVVEMTVVLSYGPRSRALALRLEQLPAAGPRPDCPPVRPGGSAPRSRPAS